MNKKNSLYDSCNIHDNFNFRKWLNRENIYFDFYHFCYFSRLELSRHGSAYAKLV